MNAPAVTNEAPRGRGSLQVFFLLFTVSGFSGLIYESIWSHYLKLFLGHAAYAQTLVLIIFMGGLAAGSWLAATMGGRWRRPILVYALVEGVIGVLALVFHPVFQGLTAAFYSSILPAVGDPALGSLLKWLAAGLLIAPQSILLGMTFPLLTGGVLRRNPENPGSTLGMLYFTNSLGGAVGVLVSGFWLLDRVGLPGTISLAGVLNVLLAVLVWLLVRRDPGDAPARPEPALPGESGTGLSRLLLLAAFLTGAASFIYEVGWIRMLSLVLGATTHAFELMLSAFIAGLALGGLWIRSRIDRLADPVQFAAWLQILMGVLAVLSIAVYAQSFGLMSGIMVRLPRTEHGFLAFTLASHGIAGLVMLPATFIAGMTLPLFTAILLRRGSGEAAIGRVYAANTVGAIAGVLFAVHVGLPGLGLKYTVAAGALLDVGLGLALLAYAGRQSGAGYRPLAQAALIGAAFVASGLAVTVLDPRILASGVYRYGRPIVPAEAEVAYYQDGKTASIAVLRWVDGIQTIATNGKPDASLQTNPKEPSSPDETTMVMLATLPLAYKPDARRVANIGFGSGMTTHTLLGDRELEVVDTIEIEPAMPEGARSFGPMVERAFTDPRSVIHFEDAKTFFPLHGVRYDAIIAEPSNPWVSGVSSLFSDEFYALASQYLVDDGVLVQWVQFYEFNDELLVSVLKAMAPHFDDFAVYSSSDFDGIIVARKSGKLGSPDVERIFGGAIAADLRRVGLPSPTQLLARQVATREVIVPLLARYDVPANSDFYPYLDLHAPKARFMRQTADLFLTWHGAGAAPPPPEDR